MDALGEKIRLTYKGEMTYKTYVGAFFTLLQRAVLIIYIIYELYLLITVAHPIESTTYRLDNFEVFEPISLRETGF